MSSRQRLAERGQVSIASALLLRKNSFPNKQRVALRRGESICKNQTSQTLECVALRVGFPRHRTELPSGLDVRESTQHEAREGASQPFSIDPAEAAARPEVVGPGCELYAPYTSADFECNPKTVRMYDIPEQTRVIGAGRVGRHKALSVSRDTAQGHPQASSTQRSIREARGTDP